MTIYYVNKNGTSSDSNNGTSPSTAWATISKALGATGMSSGDTLYVGPGVYRETITVNIASITTATNIIADVDGSQNQVTPGEVRVTAYTSGDTSAPSATVLLNLNANGNLVFSNFVFVGGSGGVVSMSNGVCVSTTFKDCTFISVAGSSKLCINGTVTVQDTALNWTFDRCRFLHMGATAGTGDCIKIAVTTGSTSLNTGVMIRNCLFIGGTTTSYAVANTPTQGGYGSGAGTIGGITVQNCTILGFGGGAVSTGASASTANPVLVYNNLIITGGTALSSQATSQITEDYNFIYAPTLRTNVSTGTHSQANNYSPLFHLGQEIAQGKVLRPFGMPTSDSPLLGYGNGGTSPTVDIMNRVRPSGPGVTIGTALPGIGAYERHDFAIKNTVIVDQGSSIQMTGPGDHNLYIPVNAKLTTVTIKVYRDGNYGGGTNPQIILQPNGEVGITSTQTVTDAGAAQQWNVLSISFTPTALGWVTLTLNSSAAGNGNVYWDTMTVAG